MNIVAIIVTYNRIELLMEAVAAVKGQTLPVSKIVVVDNGSNDGTGSWLDNQQGLTVVHQVNSGGSGGFHSGILKAMEYNADWLWVMDDDTICLANTLEVLVQRVQPFRDQTAFIGSKCIWTDGTPHLMNLPAITPSFNNSIPFNKFDDQGLLLIETCSFVSLLISTKAVRLVGLPYRDFFIWGDDQEFTRRMTKTGLLGFYCIDSIAVHKTAINYFPDFYRDTPANIWKHNYGFRNEFFMVKKNRGRLYFMFWLPVKVIYTSAKLIAIRRKDRLRFIGVILNSAWRSVFFDPQITYVK